MGEGGISFLTNFSWKVKVNWPGLNWFLKYVIQISICEECQQEMLKDCHDLNDKGHKKRTDIRGGIGIHTICFLPIRLSSRGTLFFKNGNDDYYNEVIIIKKYDTLL